MPVAPISAITASRGGRRRWRRFLLAASTFALLGSAQAADCVIGKAYTAPGDNSCTVPSGITSVNVVVIGGSGGSWGGTGGRGANVLVTSYSVTPGATLPLRVGSQGDIASGNGGGGSQINAGAQNQIIAGGGGGGAGGSIGPSGTTTYATAVSEGNGSILLTLPPPSQTVTFANPGTQTFGTSPTLTAFASSGLAPTFTSSTAGVCSVTSDGRLAFVTVGTCTINANQSGGSGYNPASQVSQSFTVTPANQAISFANPGSKTLGTTPTLTATATSGLTVTFTSATTGVCAITSGGALTFVTGGTCTINANQAGNGNYNAAPQVSQSFSVNKASQSINFTNPGAKTFGTTPTLSATAASGLVVIFTSATTGVCTISSGGTLSFVTVGTCTINANQAGDGSYNAAPQVSQSFTVNPVAPGLPTAVSGTAGNGSVSVSWAAPASNGGSAITGYLVQFGTSVGGPYANASGGCAPATATIRTATSCTATGLSNGTTYFFKVAAVSSAGIGNYSSASAGVTPAAPPSPPLPSIPNLFVGMTGNIISPVILPNIPDISVSAAPAALGPMVDLLNTGLNTRLQLVQQTTQGTVILQGYQGGSLAFVPYNFQTGDARADGIYPLGDGRFQLVVKGNSLTIAPALAHLDQLMALLPGVQVVQADNGVLTAYVGGVAHVVQPSVGVSTHAGTGVAQLVMGSDGYYHFIDAQGNEQTLYPGFREPGTLRMALLLLDPGVLLTVNLDGTATVQALGRAWTLVPDLTLIPVPSERLGQPLWQTSANRWCYANAQYQPVAGMAQCLTVR